MKSQKPYRPIEFTFDPIAERDLEFFEGDQPPRPAKVRFGRPVFIPPEGEASGVWLAPYEIAIEGEEPVTAQAYGEDSLQALQLAQGKIGAELRHLFNGRFEWFGDPDIGFPDGSGEGEPEPLKTEEEYLAEVEARRAAARAK
jgi:hypothetical protein